jgi:hypothetical protein
MSTEGYRAAINKAAEERTADDWFAVGRELHWHLTRMSNDVRRLGELVQITSDLRAKNHGQDRIIDAVWEYLRQRQEDGTLDEEGEKLLARIQNWSWIGER